MQARHAPDKRAGLAPSSHVVTAEALLTPEATDRFDI